MTTTTIEVRTRVRYSRTFLRNTGQYAGDAAFKRGVAIDVQPMDKRRLVTIRWDDGTESRVLDVNLVREDRVHLEAH